MKQTKKVRSYLAVFAIITIALIFVGCEAGLGQNTPPEVLITSPSKDAIGVDTNGAITATFKETLDPATITNSTFTVSKDGVDIDGIVTYDGPNRTVIFTPSTVLSNSKEYTATLTTGVQSTAQIAMAEEKVWIFTTGVGLSPVALGTSENYVILAKTGISTVPASVITGDVGISPAAESYLTGFSQTDATGYATSPQVTGFLYAADMAPPTSINLTTAVEDMLTAYSDAAGRVNPDSLNLKSGAIGGENLSSGLYKWTTDVDISGSNLTINGGATDTWIFQIDGNLSLANALDITLSGGALAENIFWQVAGTVTMGANSHFKGVVLCKTNIAVGNQVTMNGRLLAQTSIALDQATVTQP